MHVYFPVLFTLTVILSPLFSSGPAGPGGADPELGPGAFALRPEVDATLRARATEGARAGRTRVPIIRLTRGPALVSGRAESPDSYFLRLAMARRTLAILPAPRDPEGILARFAKSPEEVDTVSAGGRDPAAESIVSFFDGQPFRTQLLPQLIAFIRTTKSERRSPAHLAVLHTLAAGEPPADFEDSHGLIARVRALRELFNVVGVDVRRTGMPWYSMACLEGSLYTQKVSGNNMEFLAYHAQSVGRRSPKDLWTMLGLIYFVPKLELLALGEPRPAAESVSCDADAEA